MSMIYYRTNSSIGGNTRLAAGGGGELPTAAGGECLKWGKTSLEARRPLILGGLGNRSWTPFGSRNLGSTIV